MSLHNHRIGKVEIILMRTVTSDIWNELSCQCCHLLSIPTFPSFRSYSSITFFRELSPVFPHQPLTSRFVISPHPHMCGQNTRTVDFPRTKYFILAGERVNVMLLTYILAPNRSLLFSVCFSREFSQSGKWRTTIGIILPHSLS